MISNEVRQGNDFRNCEVKLMRNIDFSCSNGLSPIGDKITNFNGTFNGNGFKILGLEIVENSMDCTGFIAYLGKYGVLKNLSLAGNCNITGIGYVGALVGHNEGYIMYCSSRADVNGCFSGQTAGIVGYNSVSGVIEDCRLSYWAKIKYFSNYGIPESKFVAVNDGTYLGCKTFYGIPW